MSLKQNLLSYLFEKGYTPSSQAGWWRYNHAVKDRSKYKPHQGAQECARRVRQRQAQL